MGYIEGNNLFGERSEKKAWPPTVAVVFVAFFGFLALDVFVLRIVFPPQRVDHAMSACLSNVKQQALASLMYANDYDDRFPVASAWMDDLMPYAGKSPRIFNCHAVPTGYGYAMNQSLSEKPQPKVKEPEKAALVFESTDVRWNATGSLTAMLDRPRHGSRVNVGYADGHAHGVLAPGK